MMYQLDVNKKYYIKLLSFIFILIGLFFLNGCSLPSITKKPIGFSCKTFRPICGEDDITYYNKCQAEESGAEIAYEGACNGTLVKTIPYEKAED